MSVYNIRYIKFFLKKLDWTARCGYAYANDTLSFYVEELADAVHGQDALR